MVLTRLQKEVVVKDTIVQIKKSASLIFVDLSGVPTADLIKLRVLARSLDLIMKVIKKRLLNIAITETGGDFNPASNFDSQVGVIFIPGEIIDVASPIYKLLKTLAKPPKILGAYILKEKKFMDGAQFTIIAKLPSREVLLTQLVYLLGSPLRRFMMVLNGRAKSIQ